jgi:hypothetical protein
MLDLYATGRRIISIDFFGQAIIFIHKAFTLVSAFYFAQEGDDLKLADKLSNEVKSKLNQIKSPEKEKHLKKANKHNKNGVTIKKEEKVNWHEIMNSNMKTLRRGKGGAWR